jgi:RNA polymerase sigma-70 factor (ECF subfamily)
MTPSEPTDGDRRASGKARGPEARTGPDSPRTPEAEDEWADADLCPAEDGLTDEECAGAERTDLSDAADPGLSASERKGDEDEDIAQLMAPDGVLEDMSTVALSHSPAAERPGPLPESLIAAPMPAQLAGMSDAEIMRRAGAGDDACFEYLTVKYRRAIVAFMYRTVHNQAVAEELAQEVFLRVYRARASYRADARFTTWLYRIAANMAINHARDTKYERASSSVYLDQTDEESGAKPDVADMRPIVEQDLLRNEKMRRIREQVMALPERQRMAVVMHKYQDMDYRQIGAVLKLSESATKSLLFRAYQTLRNRLQEFA